MSILRTYFRPAFLLILVLILPQCSDKNTSQDYYQSGLAKIEQQDFDGAEEDFQKAIEINPKNPDGYYGLGGIYNYRNEFEAAEKAFKSTLRLDPTYVDAHYSLGYTYEKMGQKDKAEKEFVIYRRLKKKKDEYLKEPKESP